MLFFEKPKNFLPVLSLHKQLPDMFTPYPHFALRLPHFFFLLYIYIGVIACKKETATTGMEMQGVETTLQAENPKLRLVSADESGIDFQNRIIQTYENNITTNINIFNGGGVAIADVNNDNLPDIYFVCSNGENKLYINQGGMKFKDATAGSGLESPDGFETAVTAVDINNDGWLDFYICRAGADASDVRRNLLFINKKNGTFTEAAAEYGINDASASTGANFFDYDNDGDLDLYLVNYPVEGIWTNKIEAKLGADDKYYPQLEPRTEYDTDRLYRNDNGKFTDVSKQAGIWNLAYGLSVSVSDFNRDGYTDVYVGNDFLQPDRLYINNRNGTFTDRLGDYFKHTSQHTMGTELNDFDNDGLIDLFALDMLPNTYYRQKAYKLTAPQSMLTALRQNGYFEPVVRNVLQRNNGNGTFCDIGVIAGISQTDWSWSGLMFDIDNDGLRDVHITNGYRCEVHHRDFIDFIFPKLSQEAGDKKLRDHYKNLNDLIDQIPTYKTRNFCFQNAGNWQFNDMGGQWATMPASWSCGSAWADLDADGDLDLVVNNLEDPAFLYENTSKGQAGANYLQLKLQGSPQNIFAVGASAAIAYNNGQQQYLELNPTRGIFSSTEHLLHFGLGNAGSVDKLTVRWPDGKTQVLENVNVNQRLTLKYTDASGYTASLQTPASTGKKYFTESPAPTLPFTHAENDYNDFEQFPMNPWTMSDLGPLIAVGDVNGDGLDDCFIGSGFDKEAGIFRQNSNGKFAKLNIPTLEADKVFEDHGAVFFDADGDGDLDLYVVSGGFEATSNQAWQHRLYINLDGRGKFARAQNAAPTFNDVAMRIVAHDFDADGDQDLFIGGRVTPGKWPLTPRSVILRSDGNQLTDVTAQVGPEFERCGMVTDMVWTDLDGDKSPELIVCGEWMPITVFKLQNGKLTNATAAFGLEKSNGLWYRLAAADLDGDGDMDLVSGNLGKNTRFNASIDEPFQCFAHDFDKNGTIDPIMAFYQEGKLYPTVQRDVLVKQMPALKKKFLHAHDYGQATIDMVWPQSDLDQAVIHKAYTLETSWWENKNGKLVRHSLPLQAQLAPIQGILTGDFTGDGITDILMAGNKYGIEAETHRCDAGSGVLLAGNGKGQFTWVNNLQSGFWAPNEVRDMGLLRGPGGKKTIVVVNNSGAAQVFE